MNRSNTGLRVIASALIALVLILMFGMALASNISDRGNDRSGFIALQASASASPTPTETPMQLVVEVNSANLRRGPGTDYGVVGGVRENTRMTVMGYAIRNYDDRDEGWYLVQLNDPIEQAWIAEWIVRIVGDDELVPTIDLTEFYDSTNTPTWTPGGPTVTVTRTPRPTNTLARTPSRTPTPISGTTQPPATIPPHPTNTAQPQVTNTPLPPSSSTPLPIPTLTYTPVPPTNEPPTNPPPSTNTPLPPPTNPPAFTSTPMPTNSGGCTDNC